MQSNDTKGELNVEPSLSIVHARIDVFGVRRHFKDNHENDPISDEEKIKVRSFLGDVLRVLPSLEVDNEIPLARRVMDTNT